jgi:hypothetical protein
MIMPSLGNKARFKDPELAVDLDLIYLTDHVRIQGTWVLVRRHLTQYIGNHHGIPRVGSA